ncbi:MAG: tRNA lysidine(34) synthetase TilS [Lachnospiraceae bacterium]|nr:tRNA lysidine(34) synthetase TilS [Lachnospiraceae bacterium]
MVESGDSVVVGVSGGADSMCLLFLMSEIKDILGLSLSAVHVHHGIRGLSADEDQSYVEKECKKLGIPCLSVREDVPGYAREKGLSEEEAGRIIRYRAFRKSRPDRIAVAHHAEDSAETTLFNLFRGTGLKGLSGIKPVSGDLIRPLIYFTREEIEEYCKSKGIEYRQDETNREDVYARNRIRHNIIPEAEKINSAAAKHIVEASERIGEAWGYLEGEAERIFNDCTDLSSMPEKLILYIDKIRDRERFMRSIVIKKCIVFLAGREKDITAVHVEDTWELINSDSGKKLSLPYGIIAEKSFNTLIFSPAEKEVSVEEQGYKNEISFDVKEGEGELRVSLPNGVIAAGAIVGREEVEFEDNGAPENAVKNLRYTKWLDYDKIRGNAVWRTRRPGDRISIKDGTKKLKDLFIEEKIPADKRDSICFLATGNEVIWVPGFRIGHAFKVTEQTGKILKVSLDL